MMKIGKEVLTITMAAHLQFVSAAIAAAQENLSYQS